MRRIEMVPDRVNISRAANLAMFAGLALLLLIPYPGNLINFLVRDGTLAAAHEVLQNATLSLSFSMLHAVGSGQSHTVMGTDGYPLVSLADFQVRIAPSCAGYQGVLSSWLFLSIYLYLNRHMLNVPRCLIVLLMAGIAIFLLNAFRIATLLYIGAHGAPGIAANGFHSNFGALALLIVTALAAGLMRTRYFRAPNSASVAGSAARNSPAVVSELARNLGLIRPLVVMLALSLAVGVTASEINWLYPLPVGVAALMVAVRWRGWLGLLAGTRPALPVVAGIACYLLWITLVSRDHDRELEMQGALNAAPVALAVAWIGLRMLGATLVVPLVEELAFRGGMAAIVRQWTRDQLGEIGAIGAAVILPAIVFGLLHQNVIAAITAGLIYGWLRYTRAGLGGAVLAHGTTNCLLGLHVLLTGGWSYW